MQTKNYARFRRHIQTGDMYFAKGTSLFAQLIQLITRSHVSHAGIFLWVEGRLFIAEATTRRGVSMRLASEVLDGSFTCYWGRPSRRLPSQAKIKKSIFWTLGHHYDYAGAITSPFTPPQVDDVYFCSEWVAEVLGLSFPASKRGTTPDDLTKICPKFARLKFDKKS